MASTRTKFETCVECAYSMNKDCRVMKEKSNDCWNHTSKADAERREVAINRYYNQKMKGVKI